MTETVVDNNEIIHYEADRMRMNYSVDSNAGTTTYDLTLSRVDQADSGKYVCSHAERLAHEDSKTYHLIVESPSQGKDIMCCLNFFSVILFFISKF